MHWGGKFPWRHCSRCRWLFVKTDAALPRHNLHLRFARFHVSTNEKQGIGLMFSGSLSSPRSLKTFLFGSHSYYGATPPVYSPAVAMTNFFVALLALLFIAREVCAFSAFSLRPKVPSCIATIGTRSDAPCCIRWQHTTLSSTTTATSAAPSANLGVTKGDTKGANLLLTDLHISTGAGVQILKSINFRVDPRERWGIVGPNGCGKSTVRDVFLYLARTFYAFG